MLSINMSPRRTTVRYILLGLEVRNHLFLPPNFQMSEPVPLNFASQERRQYARTVATSQYIPTSNALRQYERIYRYTPRFQDIKTKTAICKYSKFYMSKLTSLNYSSLPLLNLQTYHTNSLISVYERLERVEHSDRIIQREVWY